MASPLDLSILNSFSIVFSMILVWVVVYGILSSTNVFGKKPGLHSMIAFCVAIMILIAPKLSKVITTMTPWFIVLFLFLTFMLVFYRMMGTDDKGFADALKNNKTISTWILIISFLVLIASLGSVFFSDNADTGVVVHPTNGTVTVSGDINSRGTGAAMATLFHPKVLGVIIMLLIGTFTIVFLSSPSSP